MNTVLRQPIFGQ